MFSCEADGRKSTGKYSGSLTCEIVRCPAAAPVAKAKACPLANFHEGCTVSCVNGYNPSGNSSEFTCYANGRSTSGKWEQDPEGFKCNPQKCLAAKPAEQDPHADGSGQPGCPDGEFDGKSGSALPGTCSLKCEDGYDASNQTPYTCGADGKWSGGSLTCSAISCGDAPSPPHSTGCAGRSKTFNETCKATCDIGYAGGPDNRDDTVFTCGANGRFTPAGSSLQCKPRPCYHANASLPHGTAGDCQKSALQNGYNCTPDCNTKAPADHYGYYLVGDRVCHLGSLTDTAVCVRCDDKKCAHSGTCVSDPGNTDLSERPRGYRCDCSTADGWGGPECVSPENQCTPRPCNIKDKGAQCKATRADKGFECSCTTNEYKGETCEDQVRSFAPWEIACVITTILSVLPVPRMVKRFKKSLETLEDPHLPEGKDALGTFGLFMCIFGVFDLVLDCLLASTLSGCNQGILLGCCIVTVVVTTTMTWYLGYITLRHIVLVDTRANSPAKEWLIQNPLIGPCVVLCSSSRLNSMAILRLHIGGRMLIDFPDSEGHRYFYFLKNSGMYHFWVEDIPHCMLSLALLHSAGIEGFQACTNDDNAQSFSIAGTQIAELPVSDKNIAIASLVFSVGSIVFGLIQGSMQMLTMKMVTAQNEADSAGLPVLANMPSGNVQDALALLKREGWGRETLIHHISKSDESPATEGGGGGGRELQASLPQQQASRPTSPDLSQQQSRPASPDLMSGSE